MLRYPVPTCACVTHAPDLAMVAMRSMVNVALLPVCCRVDVATCAVFSDIARDDTLSNLRGAALAPPNIGMNPALFLLSRTHKVIYCSVRPNHQQSSPEA